MNNTEVIKSNLTVKSQPLLKDLKEIIAFKYPDLEMIRLCSHHKDPFTLWDDQPVWDISQDQFVRIFDYKNDHYFLTQEQVFRFAGFLQLDLPQVIALMLKANWEIHLAEAAGYTEGDSDLKTLLNDNEGYQGAIDSFAPKTSTIFGLINQIKYATILETTREHVNFIKQDLLVQETFLGSNLAISDHYPDKPGTEAFILSRATEEQIVLYRQLKTDWQTVNHEFEEYLLLLEKKKKMTVNLTDQYYERFGGYELTQAELKIKISVYKEVLKIKESDALLSYCQAYKRAEETIREEEKEREAIKNKLLRSFNRVVVTNEKDFVHIRAQDLSGMNKLCKKILKKLYFLLHPDRIDLKNFSEQDIRILNELWLRTMKQSEEELFSYSSELLLYSQPSYLKLKSILIEACEVHGVDIEDLEIGDRLDYLIKKNSSIEKLIEFLEFDTNKLQEHLGNLEEIQTIYTGSDQAESYRQTLSDQDSHQADLGSKIEQLSKQVTKLRKAIKVVFKKVES